MLALSLYCSSQTIYAALYKKNKILISTQKKITGKGIESIFELIEKCFEVEDIKKLSRIFFSTGPGSFTALRSIKSIAESLSLSTNAEIICSNSFIPSLINYQNKYSEIIVCLKSLKNKSFFQLFKISKKSIKKISKVSLANTNEIIKFYEIKKKKFKDLIMITDCKIQLSNFKLRKIRCEFSTVNAKKIAEVCIMGYGQSNKEINYHTSYYEKN